GGVRQRAGLGRGGRRLRQRPRPAQHAGAPAAAVRLGLPDGPAKGRRLGGRGGAAPPVRRGRLSMLRVLIVDDEPLARERLRRLLEREKDVEVAGECRNAGEALRSVRALRPDLVFLDVQMPGPDGFALLEALPSPPPAVVFVTAYDNYAVQAFEVRAL